LPKEQITNPFAYIVFKTSPKGMIKDHKL